MYSYLRNTKAAKTEEELKNLWSFNNSIQWLRHLIDDEFNRKMKWANETGKSTAYMTEAVASITGLSYRTDTVVKLAEQLCYDELDIVRSKVEELVSDFTIPNPWMVFNVVYRGDVAAVASDEDYRIKVYNEKTTSGEW